MTILLTATSAVAFGPACGGGGGSPVTVDNLGTQLGKATCGVEFRCCSDTEIMQDFMGVTVMNQPITTEAQCESFYSGFIGGLLVPQLQASIAAGRIKYDADAAGDCIADVQDEPCDPVKRADFETDCKPFIIPLVDTGGGCTQSDECKTDFCDGASSNGSGSSTDGMCKEKPGLGSDCTGKCATGLFCDFGSDGETCVMTKGDGMPCDEDNECTNDHCVRGSGDTGGSCGTPAPRCDGR